MSDTEQKVVAEQAEVEFQKFAEAMDLDVDYDRMGSADKADLEGAKFMFLRAVRRGFLVVNENGEPVFTPQRSDNTAAITFKEPTGASLQAMDSIKKDRSVSKMYAIMGDISGESVARFSKLKNADLNVCMAVLLLFLG